MSEDDGPLVTVDVEQSLHDAVTSLRTHCIHRLLVTDAPTGNPLHLLSYKPILRFLRQCVSISHTHSDYNCMIDMSI